MILPKSQYDRIEGACKHTERLAFHKFLLKETFNRCRKSIFTVLVLLHNFFNSLWYAGYQLLVKSWLMVIYSCLI